MVRSEGQGLHVDVCRHTSVAAASHTLPKCNMCCIFTEAVEYMVLYLFVWAIVFSSGQACCIHGPLLVHVLLIKPLLIAEAL